MDDCPKQHFWYHHHQKGHSIQLDLEKHHGIQILFQDLCFLFQILPLYKSLLELVSQNFTKVRLLAQGHKKRDDHPMFLIWLS